VLHSGGAAVGEELVERLGELAGVGVENGIDLLLETLRDRAGAVAELGLDLPRDLLELGLDELGVRAGLLAVEHTGADLDRVDHEVGRIGARLFALAHEANRRLIGDGEVGDVQDVAGHGDARGSEGECGFHNVGVARYAWVLTERALRCIRRDATSVDRRPGLISVVVLLDSEAAVVIVEAEDLDHLLLDPHPADVADAEPPGHHEHVIAEVLELHRLELELAEQFAPVVPELLNAGVALEGARLGIVGWRGPFDVGRHVREHPIAVARVPGHVAPLDQLHVLLPHCRAEYRSSVLTENCNFAILACMQASGAITHVSVDEATDVLAKLARQLMGSSMRAVMGEIERLDLSFAQLKSLGVLEQEEGLSIKTMSDRLGLSEPGVSRGVDILVKRGLVKRIDDPDDRRFKRVSLTAKGRSVIGGIIELRTAGFRTYVDTLDDTERDALVAVLQPLLEGPADD
jgi:DNA-binding MarR family transcriptional regulator